MTREEKLVALLQDEEACREIFTEDADQTLANLAAHGVELSREELAELSACILESVDVPEGELSEGDLEDVAGGGAILEAVKNGLSDGYNVTDKGIQHVESAKSYHGKAIRAITYSGCYGIGKFLRRFR